MESIWDEYFALSKDQQKGIEWNGEKMRPAKFDDVYLAICKDAGLKPSEKIYNHFWKNCVNIQGYTPKFCEKKEAAINR